MMLDIPFPLEFAVHGTPVSLQSKNAQARESWREKVRTAGRAALPADYFATLQSLAVTLYYFPRARMSGDIDNIVKPVLDALREVVYLDDRQIERIVVQRFEPDRVGWVRIASPLLDVVLNGEGPVLFVKVSDDISGEFD